MKLFMKQNQINKKSKIRNRIIIILSLISLIACITVLFPQVRRLILDLAIQSLGKEPISYEMSLKLLLSFALGGICFIIFFDYCTLTNSGRKLTKEVIQEMKDCLCKIDFKDFIKPALLMFVIYLLGTLAIIRANTLYGDEISWSITGYRSWYDWSRYVIMFLSYIIHPEIRITDISPLPQLMAITILSFSSVLLVYILCKRKISTIGLLASIPIGLSPFFLECLSYKFAAVYGALPIILSIIPFLFITHKKAFFFSSLVFLLILSMVNQAASGIYPMIVIILCFQDWNSREKTNKELLSFIGISAAAFCLSMLIFRFFIMKSFESDNFYTSTATHTLSNLLPGLLNNFIEYTTVIYQDLSVIWVICILLVFVFVITKSTFLSSRNKILSFFTSIIVICVSFIWSYGIYLLLARPFFSPRSICGFGVFLAILCIYIVSNYKKMATIIVIALNWCFFVFAFSYGNALADHVRYANFREGILLHDLNTLYLDHNIDKMSIQLKNSIDYSPTVKNIAKHNPIIKKLVPIRLGATDIYWDHRYFLDHYNYNTNVLYNDTQTDYDTFDLPVVLDSYYHTIKSDGEYILVILKH